MQYNVKMYFNMPDATAILPKVEQFLKHEKVVSNNGQTFRKLVFDSESALFHYVRGFDYTKQDGEKGNRILEAVMTAPNDSQRHKLLFDRHTSEYYYLGYLIKDETGRTIDLRNYEKELYKFDYAGYVRALREKHRLEHIEWCANYDLLEEKYNKLFEGKRHWWLLKWAWIHYRCMRTMRERRYASDPEQKPFIRGKRRHLPDPWGAETVVCFEKTWKARATVKHQWQVNKPRHKDTVHYKKRTYDEELLMEHYTGTDDVLLDD